MTDGPRKGEAMLDPWTLVHMATGAVMGLFLRTWWLVAVLLIVYEAFEALLRRVKLEDGGLFEYESWANIGADVILAFVAFGVVAWTLGPVWLLEWW